jgi:hypothetical protein
MFMALIGLIPGLLSLVEKWQKNKTDAQVAITTAKLGVDRDKAVAIVQAASVAEHENTARLGVVASNKLLTVLVLAFATPLVVFMWKVVLWDKILGLGVTPALTGQVSDWATTIISFVFGAPTAVALARTILKG